VDRVQEGESIMDQIDKEQLLNTAWKHFGSAMQMDILIEEMAELTHAILAARRNNTFYTYAVSEEVADVLICLEQLEMKMRSFPTTETNGDEIKIVGCVFDQVEHIKETKLLRLKERLLKSMEQKHFGDGK